MNPFASAIAFVCVPTGLLAGCSATRTVQEPAANPTLRQIQPPPSATAADTDRAALARFVGVWNFEGWSVGPGGARVPGRGTAAAAIESEHFILIDVRTTEGSLASRAGRKSGSMLLASEPGLGLTLTAWGDASPAVRRLKGRSAGAGSAFIFNETGSNLALTLSFQTDDRWTAEVREPGGGEGGLVASYTFARDAR